MSTDKTAAAYEAKQSEIANARRILLAARRNRVIGRDDARRTWSLLAADERTNVSRNGTREQFTQYLQAHASPRLGQ